MISVENLHKSYGGQHLFEGVRFKINPRERVGLVGRNGHGKTTLFRIIAGLEEPDEGRLNIPRNYRIGYVQQHLKFTGATILAEGMQSLPANERDHHWKVERILAGLGFSTDDFDRSPGEFSGGFQVRLNLAKALIAEPDLLLLDEPTNYLDIASIRWIEVFLSNWPHELMLITHDRGFMDKLVTHIIGIHRGKIKKIPGNTEKYYSQIVQEEAIYEKTRINDEKRRKEVAQFINRFRAKARLANLVQSRVKTLAKMEKKEKLEATQDLEFSIASIPFKGRHVFTAENIAFGYEKDRKLFSGLNISVNTGERIGIIGKNGRGKTTLLKVLANVLAPQAGRLRFNPNIQSGYFEQSNAASLVDARTVEEEILLAQGGSNRQAARNICGAMLFSGDNALKKIGVLSGGEKSRVMLGKILITPVNLLLLDEPTNHLDMDACDTLLAALDHFDGTVIMVTHNEMFLHALARRLIVFQDDRADVFEGSYQDFLDKVGWRDEAQATKNSATPAPENNSRGRLTKKKMRQQRSEIVTRRINALKPVAKEMAAVENKIEELEKEMTRYNQQM
ncbi:MAG: ABC-F family ATP-binding cassette domain-containing protein, partial [Thermodesulfobacteriota bacterium]|nr:ABC-F family ATP-binding cassette domain-containing protein [Thermodesulfobacteriota bacterium]